MVYRDPDIPPMVNRDPDMPIELWNRMRRVVKPAGIGPWMDKEVPALDGQTPRAVLRAGNVQAIEEIISGLESPGVA